MKRLQADVIVSRSKQLGRTHASNRLKTWKAHAFNRDLMHVKHISIHDKVYGYSHRRIQMLMHNDTKV